MSSGTRTPLGQLIAARIRERGPIPFAEFMRACLYHPEHGYYSRPESRRFADFYTSVDVHPIFGRLIARQLAEMWELLGRPQPFWAVEVGAGAGRLAAQVLDFAARELSPFYAAIKYVAVEQSATRRSAARAVLERHAAAGRLTCAASPPAEVPGGCIFSNELLDAFPVHRVVCERGNLREIYVGLRGDDFGDEVGPVSTPAVSGYFDAQGMRLLEGQQAEVGLAACKWIQDAGRRLGRGFTLTIDYGHEARELYDELHLRGTLLAYRQHGTGEDYYRAPGEQDLTAHVNFTALELWGRRAGLERTGLVSQARFLLALGRGNEFADLYEPGQSETERLRARLLLKNLIFPEGMGEAFQVLIQHKDIVAPRLTGLAPF